MPLLIIPFFYTTPITFKIEKKQKEREREREREREEEEKRNVFLITINFSSIIAIFDKDLRKELNF